jgi:carboxyl-terminal processing protease
MRFMLIIILFFISNSAFSQTNNDEIGPKANPFGLEVLKIIKDNSLFSDSLNWRQVSSELATLQLQKNDSLDKLTILNFFINKLKVVGDNHSFYSAISKAPKQARQTNEPEKPESQYLGNGIGIIKVPMFMSPSSEKIKEFANSIRNQIKKLDTENDIKGWIVDLRNNDGGNMWPMIAGLNALFKDGTVGYFVGNKKSNGSEWNIRNGKINLSKERVDTYKVKNLDSKIAILINSNTASSAEMTAVTFIGLPNARLFGQPSAGYTTANSDFNLSNGWKLYLATNLIADRNHKVYSNKVIPDFIVEIDTEVSAAEAWLLGKPRN